MSSEAFEESTVRRLLIALSPIISLKGSKSGLPPLVSSPKIFLKGQGSGSAGGGRRFGDTGTAPPGWRGGKGRGGGGGANDAVSYQAGVGGKTTKEGVVGAPYLM